MVRLGCRLDERKWILKKLVFEFFFPAAGYRSYFDDLCQKVWALVIYVFLFMRYLILISICCFGLVAKAQTNLGIDTSLKFDQRYTKCERKWVVLAKTDTERNYSFGYIYVDAQAGFTYDLKGVFKVDAKGRYISDTNIFKNTGSIKYRIASNWKKVALLDKQHFKELKIKPEPDWIKTYYGYKDTIQHQFRWGFIYNDLNECDTALVYLTKAYKVKPHYPGLEFELIFAYNALLRYDDAIRILDAAVQNDPKNVLFYRELGYAYLNKSIYDKAIGYYKQGIDMCTDAQKDAKAEMAINMAGAYKSKGDLGSFKEWGQKAKEWAQPGSSLYNFIVSKGF